MCEESLASILFDTVKCGILVIDYDTRLVVDMNPAACLMFGTNRDNIINTLCRDLTCSEIEICSLENEETIEDEEVSITRPDGTIVHLLRTASVIFWKGRKLIVESFLDVTPIKEIGSRLRRERNRAQAYLDIAGSMFIALNDNGIITLINQKGCEILEMEEQNLIGLNWFDNFIPEAERELVKNLFSKLISGKFTDEELYHENTIVTSKGEERIIKWHNSVVYDEGGKALSTLSSGEDITDQRKMELKLKEIWKDAEQLLSENLSDMINNGNGYNFESLKSGYKDLDKVLLSLTKEG